MLEDKAQISIDFLAAVSIFMITIGFVIYSFPVFGFVHDEYSESNNIDYISYRISESIIKDSGFLSENDTSWESEWSNNKSKISNIGFAKQEGHKPPPDFDISDPPIPNVLSFYKVDGKYNDTHSTQGLMERHGEEVNWWDFGHKKDSGQEYEEAYSRSKEIFNIPEKFEFYMQLRPINDDEFDPTDADESSIKNVPQEGDTSKIERIVLMKYYDSETMRWHYVSNNEDDGATKYSFTLWVWK
ncbi:MAG: hypothetical protein EF811_02045 [Methanonatronarchaeia archaeon]|nr:MAG: hypothetical protein EF811_02045 [Methanonatronarchaeia archaeon]